MGRSLKHKQINFYVDRAEAEQFQAYCKKRGTSMSKVLTNVIKRFNQYQQSKSQAEQSA